MKNLFFFCSLCLFANGLMAQPDIEWEKTYGGSKNDDARSIVATNDGGFIMAGMSDSNNGDVSGNHGYFDYWIVKLNGAGDIQWQKSLGGSDYDDAQSIIQTADGGYMVAGISFSTDGDVSGSHGKGDFWLVKLSESGSIQWQKALGGSQRDWARAIKQTKDGGYIVTGFSKSSDGDVSAGNPGFEDIWVVKISSTGAIEWQNSYHGYAYSIDTTQDGGYILAGTFDAYPGDTLFTHGGGDGLVLKLDSNGLLQWRRALGGSNNEDLQSIRQTSDGGCIVAGTSRSLDGDVNRDPCYGDFDYWIVKLSPNGAIQWQKSLGGTFEEGAFCIQNTHEGGYVVVGFASSIDKDVTGNHGYHDMWVVELSALGNVLWEKSLGTAHYEDGASIQQLSDGGFIVAGSRIITGDNHAFYVVKLNIF